MAAPKSIQAKAVQLAKALDRVAKLSNELEEWYSGKTNWEMGQDFYIEYDLDKPFEFDLDRLLAELDRVS